MKAARWFTGWARCCLRAEHPERLLQTMAEAGLVFWEVQPPAALDMVFCIRRRDLPRLQSLAAAGGCECRILGRRGAPELFRRIRQRPWLCVLAALLLCLLGLSRLFVWRIELQGDEGLAQGRIMAALEDCGVRVGAFWPAFSQDLIRNAMLLELPELRWMTVNLRGCTAEVILRERYETPETVPEGEYGKIVAARAGVVSEVLALQGAARVTAGQAVLPGELLIDGAAEGRYESHGAVRALGSVRAQCWHEITAAAPLERSLRASAGRSWSRWSLIVGKRRINFFKGYSICPSACVKMTEEASFFRSGLFSLPLGLVKESFVEYEAQAIMDEELREELESFLYAELLARIGAEGEVTRLDFSASEAEGVLTVTLRAECEQEIGRTVPMTPEEIASKLAVQEEENE